MYQRNITKLRDKFRRLGQDMFVRIKDIVLLNHFMEKPATEEGHMIHDEAAECLKDFFAKYFTLIQDTKHLAKLFEVERKATKRIDGRNEDYAHCDYHNWRFSQEGNKIFFIATSPAGEVIKIEIELA